VVLLRVPPTVAEFAATGAEERGSCTWVRGAQRSWWWRPFGGCNLAEQKVMTGV